MTPNGALVFSVQNGIAHEHKVTTGALFGENIEIKEGLTRDMIIALDARGLKEGISVTIK